MADLSAAFTPETGEQSGLENDHALGDIRAHGLAENPATVSVQSGRQVHRQHRHTAGIDGTDRREPFAFDRTLQAGTEQRIHHHVGSPEGSGTDRFDCHTSGEQPCAGMRRIALQPHMRRRTEHLHRHARLPRQARCHVAVATVVARAADDRDPSGTRPAAAQQRQHRAAGTFHERFGHRAGRGAALDVEYLRGTEQGFGQFLHTGIIGD